MRLRLLALPLCAWVLATLDTLLTREELWHRPLGVELPMQSFVLWLGFGLLALIPASLTAPIVRRIRARADEPRWIRESLGMFGWMLAPVAMHTVLDRHTGIYADMSALAGPLPWLEAGGVLLLLIGALLLLGKLFARTSGRKVALTIGGLSLLALCFLPLRSERFGKQAVAPKDAPNLLLLVWDTTRAPSLASYGYERETTPHLAQFAEQSVLFEEARSVAVYTLTSHVTMLTGVYPSNHGSRLTRMRFNPHNTPSIARVLRDRGYRTGAFVGTGVLQAKSGIVDGFEVYNDQVDPPVCETQAWALVHDVQSILAKLWPQTFNRNGDPHGIQDFQRPADGVLAQAAEWIEADDERPWFCMVNLYDVHWPYLPDEASRERWVGEYSGDIRGQLFRHDSYRGRDNGGKDGSLLNEDDNRHLTELYDAELFELDAKVAAFLERAQVDSGRVGVIVTADHGEAFGEGGRYEHADVLEPQVRIPLLVRPPVGHPRAGLVGQRLSGKTSGVDVAPTLLGLAGIEVPAELPGFDLLATPPSPERPVLVEDRDRQNPRSIQLAYYRGTWKLVRAGLGDESRIYLFDLSSDPTGLVDVAAEHPKLCQELESELDALRATWGADDEKDALGTSLDTSGLLQGLGYVGSKED